MNLLLCLTAHGISLTSSSHVTTTVWLSDRHLSLLPRCHSGQRESPRRLQSRSLRQHGRPTDALPTGRPRNCPGSRRLCTNARTCVSRLNEDFWVGCKMISQHLLKQNLDLRAGESELEPWFFCNRRQDVLALLDQLTVATIWCTERLCVCVCLRDVFVIGVGGFLSPQSTFPLCGEGQAAWGGTVCRHFAPLPSVYAAWPLCCLLDPRANAEA